MTLEKESIQPIEQQVIDVLRALPFERVTAVLDFAAFLLTRERNLSSILLPLSPQKTGERKDPTAFLLNIASLGASGKGDVAERDEAILAAEIDPICGWSARQDERSS
ncbi:MAG: hypothetical protein KJZ86_09995 [Caldilineaceae bacterium]|nr:hypothetical protein [Caldilineaceae bacterium]HRJ42472.1 hypothetical protein [Caldilineaceae bacterium]